MGCCFKKGKVGDVKPDKVSHYPDAKSKNNNQKRQQSAPGRTNNFNSTAKANSNNGINSKNSNNNRSFIKNNQVTVDPGTSTKEIALNKSFDKETEEWFKLIHNLNSNEKLKTHATSRRRNEFANVDSLAEYLSKGPGKSDVEKAWLAFVWITDNIVYDGEGLKRNKPGKNDAESVLSSGKAVCEGYSDLYQQILSRMNIDCRKIGGYSKSFGYEIGSKLTKEDHAWNTVKIGNKLQYVEPTWGAGFLDKDYRFNKRFQPYHFFTPSNVFLEKHFSEPNQLQAKKITLTEFENLQMNELEFHFLGLKCKTFDTCKINPPTNPFLIEYESKQDVVFTTRLIEERGKELKNMVVAQSDFESSSKKYRHCFIVQIPEKKKKYKLEIYGKLKTASEASSAVYPLLTSYAIVREKDEELTQLPKYNLTFDQGVKLLSHQSKLIRFEANPLVLRFLVPNTAQTQFELNDEKGNRLENSILQHCDPANLDNTLVNVSLPIQNRTFFLNMFAKSIKDESNNLKLTGTFHLTRTRSDSSDSIKFAHVFNNGISKLHIYSPLNSSLKANVTYDFKYFVKDALKVALVDSKKNWLHLDKQTESKLTVWKLTKSIAITGELLVFAQYDANSSYLTICKYSIAN